MKIKKIKLTGFKRFTNLTIQDIPETAKVILLIGLNGQGKSSVFDALNTWYYSNCKHSNSWNESYHLKQSHPDKLHAHQAIQIEFHDPLPTTKNDLLKVIYSRSAYRNEPEFEINHLSAITSALDESRPNRMIDNDATVAQNYRRLVSQSLEDMYENAHPSTTVEAFRENIIGEIREAVRSIFPNLILNSLGNPLTGGTFKFDKGTSRGFSYKNLSAGEKAAFDLVVDIIIKRKEFDNTIYCFDEPEAHMNTRLQGALFKEMFNLVPENSQLWLATHSIGIMKAARDISEKFPGEVIFLDFSEVKFDHPDNLSPAVLNRHFWRKIIEVAFDDMADLVAPSHVIICEGKPHIDIRNSQMDAYCYEQIFSAEFPDVGFLSEGNSFDVEHDRLAFTGAIKAVSKGTKITRLIDRDDHSPEEIKQKEGKVKVLSRRHLESYLFDDEVLIALCEKFSKHEESENLIKDKQTLIQKSVAGGRSQDDIKAISGELYNAAKKRLQLSQCGNSAKAFMRDTLAPLIKPHMNIYKELRHEIFGSNLIL